MLYKQAVCRRHSYPDMTKAKKFVVAVVISIGLPLVIMLTAFACFWFMDKTNGTIVSSGLPRRYLLDVPNSYDHSKPTPLVITLHPAATWPAIASHMSRWNDLADQHGFIVVYPAGTGAFFDGLGRGPHSLPRDIRFFSDLIANLEFQYNIDLNRVYADGMSNGGGMALALSCKLSDRIAAVAAVSPALPLPGEQCGDSKPIPNLLFHGTADQFAPYHGGSSPISPGTFPDIPGWTAHAAQRNLKELRSKLASRRTSTVFPITTALPVPTWFSTPSTALVIPGPAPSPWPNGGPVPRLTKSMPPC
jgi:poly(3-hydroxybutyrate) depolymerase